MKLCSEGGGGGGRNHLQIYKSSQVQLHCFIKTILQNIFWKSSDISEYYKLALYKKSWHSQDKKYHPYD